MQGQPLLLSALDIGTTNVKGESRVYVGGELVARSTSPSIPLGFSGGIVRSESFIGATTEVLRRIFQDDAIRKYVDCGVRPRLAISQLGEAFFMIDRNGGVIDDCLYTSQSPLGRRVVADPERYDLDRVRELTARDSGVNASEEMTNIMLLDRITAEPRLSDEIQIVLSAGAYLMWMLSGQRITSISVLGRMGLANMRTNDISYPVLKACNFNPLWFPRVAINGRPAAQIDSNAAEKYHLPRNIRFYPQHHDQSMAYEGAISLTGKEFGIRTILTGTSNGICAPSRGEMTPQIADAILKRGYCFSPGYHKGSKMTFIYHFDGEPEETIMRKLADGLSRSESYEKLDNIVFESYIRRRERIRSTYIPCRLLSFPVNRFPEGRTFEDSFRLLPGESGELTDEDRLRDSMAGKILFIRAGYEEHCKLQGERFQDQFIAYGGGHAKSKVEFQMYADVLGREIHVLTGETGLKGCMLTTLTPDERNLVLPSMMDEAEIRTYQPNPERVDEFNRIYPIYWEHLRQIYPFV